MPIATPSFTNAEGFEIVSCAMEHPELDASERTDLVVFCEAHNVWLQVHNQDRAMLAKEQLEHVALLADSGMSLARSVNASTKLGKLTV